MYDLPPSQKSIFMLSLSFFEEHFLFEVGLGERFSMPTEIFASSVPKFGQLLPAKVDTRLWIFVFLSEFDFSFLTDDQKQRILEFWKFLFQQLYDQGSRKGANWRSPILILCESTICFGVVPKGLSNKIVRLVLAMFGCGLEFNGAKTPLCPPRTMGFSLLLCHRCQVCATPSHQLRLGGLLLLQLLSRHEGWGPLERKKT